MKAAECTTGHIESTAGQNINSSLIKLYKLVEEAILIDEPVDGWWLTLHEELSLIDFVAILAIIIAGYDEGKQKALRDEVYKIEPMPHQSSRNSKFTFKLLKGVILEPELFLKMVHKECGGLPLAELEILAKSLFAMQGKSENKAINSTGLMDSLGRQRKAL